MIDVEDIMLDFRIESFLEVCKYLNFTRAAESLNITQPAISTHIKYLENYYNCKLFYRSKRSLCLTDQGKILKSALLSMSNDQDRLKIILANNKTKSEKISLGFTRSVGEYLIMDKLIALIKEKSSCDFHIYYENTDEILSDIDSGRIDFAIIEGFIKSSDYFIKKYKSDRIVCLCHKDHKFKKQVKKLTDLLDERIIIREDGSGTLAILKNFLSMDNIDIKDFANIIEINNMRSIVEMLKADCGISFIFESCVKKELEEGVLRVIKLEDFNLVHDLSIVARKNSIFIDLYLQIAEAFY